MLAKGLSPLILAGVIIAPCLRGETPILEKNPLYSDTCFWKPLKPSAGTMVYLNFDSEKDAAADMLDGGGLDKALEPDSSQALPGSEDGKGYQLRGGASIDPQGRYNSCLAVGGGVAEARLPAPLPANEHLALDASIFVNAYPPKDKEGIVFYRKRREEDKRPRSNHIALSLTPGGALILRWQGLQGKPMEARTPEGCVPLKKWVHVGITYRWHTRAMIFVDGAPVGYKTYQHRWGVLDGPVPDAKDPIYLGNTDALDQPLDGKIDEFRLSSDIIEFFPLPDKSWTDPECRRPVSDLGMPYLPPRDDLVFYATFDKGLAPEIMRGKHGAGKPAPTCAPDGVRGNALHGAMTVAQEGNFPREEGTLSFWFKPLDWSNEHVFHFGVMGGPFTLYVFNSGCLRPPYTDLGIYLKDGGGAFAVIGGRHYPELWRHVAVTWKGRLVKTFLDGRFRNELTLSFGTFDEIADKWPLSFDSSGSHNAFDEVMVFKRQLTYPEIENLYWRFRDPAKMKKLPGVDVLDLCHLPGANGIFGRFDASRTPNIVRVRFEISGSKLSSPWKSEPTELCAALHDVVVKSPSLDDGEYQLTAVFLDASGKEQGRFDRPFKVKHFPWENSALGQEKIIIPPYTPIGVDGATLKPIGREIRLAKSGLPESILVGGRQILAGPIRLECVEGGRKESLSGTDLKVEDIPGKAVENREEYSKVPLTTAVPPLKLKDSPGYQAVVAGNGKLGGLEVRINATMDIDGWYRVLATVAPPAGGKSSVESLDLVIEMPKECADTMYNQVNDRSQDPSGYVNTSGEFGEIPEGRGVVWDSRKLNGGARWKTFVPQVFIGNGEQGIWWLAVSDDGWILDDKEPCVRFERDAELVRLRIRMIAAPMEIAGPRTFDFSLLVEPVKPMPERWRELCWGYGRDKRNYYGHDTAGYRYYGDSVDSYSLHSDDDVRKLAKYYSGEFEKMEPFRNYMRGHYEKPFHDQVPFTLYGSTWMTGLGMEEFKYYGREWLGREDWEPLPDWNFDGMPSYGGVCNWERPEQLDARGVNFNSTYIDCFLHYHRRLLQNAPVNGTWWDNSSIGLVTEYVPGRGRVELWNTYLRRDLTRRLAVIGYLVGRRPWWIQNMHVDFSWTQVGWHIENDFYISGSARSIIDQLGIGKFRSLLCAKRGLLGRLASSVQGAKLAGSDELTIACRSVIGMCLAHDVGDVSGMREKNSALYDAVLPKMEQTVGFFSGDPAFLPYWRQDAVKPPDPRVLCSFFIGNGKAVAVIVNATDKTRDLGEMTFDASRLGLKNPARATDLETDEDLLVGKDGSSCRIRMRKDRLWSDREKPLEKSEDDELKEELGEETVYRTVHRHDFRAVLFE